MRKRILALCITACMAPSLASACACGCGVFDVQTGSMFPSGPGGTVWTTYNFMDQDINWHNTSTSPAANNGDKEIRTDFINLGGEYMFNRSWGIEVNVPYWERYFKTTEDDGSVDAFNHGAIGDVTLQGIYSGFSADMSTGITFGVKLPTGDDTYAGFDRDTEIGTGSTDVLLGAYHLGQITKDGAWDYYVNALVDQPVLITAGYRPGSEVDAVGGVYYDKWEFGGVKVAPMFQVIGSARAHDRGPLADPDDTGYERLLVGPAVEVSKGSMAMFADVALPVVQDMRGNQLTAPALFTVSLSYSF